MPEGPAIIILTGADWATWQAGRRGQLRAGVQRLAIDTGRQDWRILDPEGQVVDEGVVTRGCNP